MGLLGEPLLIKAVSTAAEAQAWTWGWLPRVLVGTRNSFFSLYCSSLPHPVSLLPTAKFPALGERARMHSVME